MSFYKFDTDGNIIRKRVLCETPEDEEVRVEQSHKAEVDINNIVKRAGNMELIAKVSALQQFTYDDVSNNDFQETMNAIIKARDTFAMVPSAIRRQFENDAAKFMDFVYNPDNKDKLVEMGLANPPQVQEPIQVVVTNPPETPPVESSPA